MTRAKDILLLLVISFVVIACSVKKPTKFDPGEIVPTPKGCREGATRGVDC